MANNIEFLFYPNTIAVVGVSEDPHKLSSIFFNNIIDSGYKGNLHPVNPKHQSVYGYECFSKVSDIPGEVDQVAILIPEAYVLDVIKDCAIKGVKSVLIISAGFGETGAKGKAIQDEIAEIAKSSGMRILGPNIIGVINTANKLNSSWMTLFPEEGNIAFLSQSGAFCTGILDMALNCNLGFYNFCSVGNKCDVDELDLISYWYNDQNVKVLASYLEEINNGYDLIRFVNTQEQTKPLILFKPGKTLQGVKAISSHTGSLAGSVETVETAIEQSGILEVNSTDEMLSDLQMFSWSKLPTGKRIAIITNAGGPGIMATDSIIQNHLQLAELSAETEEALKQVLPPAASTHNPVDLLGDALADRYLAATEIILKDPNVDMLLYIVTPQYITQIEDTAKMIIRTKKFTQKPVYTVLMGDKYMDIGIERMQDAKVPVFREIESCLTSLVDLVKYSEYVRDRRIEDEKSMYAMVDANFGQGKHIEEVKRYLKKGELATLPDELISKIAHEVGLDTAKQAMVDSLSAAQEFAQECYPVVIKAPTDLIAHKTDTKAVFVGIKNPEELALAYAELLKNIATSTGIANAKILIQEMIIAREEVLVGATRDGNSNVYKGGESGFGHLIVFGKGGIYTEVYHDLGYALIPASDQQLHKAFNKTKISQIINGVRGQAPLALTQIVASIKAVQQMVILYPQIQSMDINPLLVNETRAVAVDIKVFVQE